MLRMLHQFKQIVESGNLSQAARVLNISQPALSKSVKVLESHFQVPLMTRETWGVSPTEYGKQLYTHVCLIDKEIENAEEAIHSMWEAASLNLSIGTGTFWNYVYFPDIVIKLQREFPTLRIAVKSGSPMDLQKQILEGKLDFAICRMPGDQHPELIYEELITVTKAVFAHDSHMLFGKKKIENDELYHHPWVLFQLDEDRGILDGFDLMHTKSLIKTNSLSIARKAISECQALTILPDVLMPLMREYNIRIIPGAKKGISYSTAMYYHKSALTRPVVKRLIELIKEIVTSIVR